MEKLTGRTATGVIGKLLGVEEGSEGAVLLAGTVNGTITGSTTAGVHSALAGNDAQTVLKDTLIGGSYYEISLSVTEKIKVVNPDRYIPLPEDKAAIIYERE